ncbi:vancomycin resistance protein YoaR [Croceifilum oryzae]|uniref:Vancomycin resistance protein YoaR n=1 Tax=Croceifilum oryzae TaxID=1553429 RepID=A0AAJ1TKD8_9BACL|nr:VanW family protein [Croceifilum oryzae]MDQ0416311.1 vancomycin resistance protein YoaR [Croceifilum oryzae]
MKKPILVTFISTLCLFILSCTPMQASQKQTVPQEKKITPSQPAKMIFQHEDQVWSLELGDIGFDGVDPTSLDHELVHSWLRTEVAPQVEKEPVSAFFKNRKLIPEKYGYKIDYAAIEEILQNVHQVLNQPQELPLQSLQPQITKQKALTLKQKRLASYQTYFNPDNENRSHNIFLSTHAIDHMIVLPGQTFSFNDVVGIRTTERGYRPARIIVKGEYSEGVGGGICQTSSTLFNSVDQAGLQIVQRYSHSKHVAYVPKDRDATVSWGGYDFKFRNQFNEPILISSRITGGILNISIYGPNVIRHQPNAIPDSPPLSQQDES